MMGLKPIYPIPSEQHILREGSVVHLHQNEAPRTSEEAAVLKVLCTTKSLSSPCQHVLLSLQTAGLVVPLVNHKFDTTDKHVSR